MPHVLMAFVPLKKPVSSSLERPVILMKETINNPSASFAHTHVLFSSGSLIRDSGLTLVGNFLLLSLSCQIPIRREQKSHSDLLPSCCGTMKTQEQTLIFISRATQSVKRRAKTVNGLLIIIQYYLLKSLQKPYVIKFS